MDALISTRAGKEIHVKASGNKNSPNTRSCNPRNKPVKENMDNESIVSLKSDCDFQQQLPTTRDNNRINVEQERDTITKHVTDDGNQHPKVNELDKFKRRMIRAIARLMFDEKKSEKEIWEVLKKETSCDCKLLWTRMRALTVKKLKRLFDANDRNENVTKIAQLSVTDWLLFDLTLVHEDVDVIGQDATNQNVKRDPQIFYDLFRLVIKYKIENLYGEQLTKAWNDLTAEYNSRGRKCSQMLLQRRWYQLKQLVRSKFYKFWFEYRGCERNLEQAEKYKPTGLDVEIVKAFMTIVTDPFPTWQQLIDDKKVSLLKDFECLRLSKKKNSQKTANEPDILLIEPHVETIDLRVDSDEDAKDSNVKNKEHGSVDPNAADSNDSLNVVKTESICDEDEDEVNILESTHIPLETKENLAINKCDEGIKASKLKETTISCDHIQGVVHTTDAIDVDQSNYDEEDSDHCIEDKIDLIVDDDDIINTQQVQGNDFEVVMPKITSITSTAQIPEINDGICETTNRINNTLDKTTDEVLQMKSYTVTSPTSNFEQITIDTTKEEKLDEEVTTDNKLIKQQSLYNEDVSHDLQLIDGIELEDDGIEYIDEDEHTDRKVADPKEGNDYFSTNNDENETPTIDLKLLLDPVVYTKKLDHMDVFRFIDYMTVKDRRVIQNAAVESKPVDKKSVKMGTISEDVSECSTENEYELIKSTSWLFRKPRGVTYNPIQLCKNPDFNTRLKRLTAGFFSSQRNRQLLKICKPLTIDVHKAFEAKLVNNSLYVEKSFFLEAKSSEIINTVEKTVLPSELPGQSLNYNVQDSIPIPSTSKLSQITKNEFIPEVCIVERNKVINLPDLEQIRRQNERLLIAEVTPLQAVSVTNPPVSIVQKNNTIEQSFLTVSEVDNNDIAKNLNNVNGNTTAVVTPELKNNDFINSDTTIKETEMLCNDNRSESNHVKIGDNPNMRTGNKIKKTINPIYNLGKVSVTWNSRRIFSTNRSEKTDDRLLAPDTVERIISVCNGNYKLTKKQNFNLRKKFYRSEKKNRGPGASVKQTVCDDLNVSVEKPQLQNNENTLTHNVIEEYHQEQQSATIQNEIVQQCDVTTETKRNCITKKTNEGVVTKTRYVKKRQNVHCCWAREKILFWQNKIQRVSRHFCPQIKCMCCCKILYTDHLLRRRQRRYVNVTSFCDLVSDDETDRNAKKLCDPQKPLKRTNERSDKITKNIVKNYTTTSNKVDIGVNTDFDKDFEESYAANINNSSFVNSVRVTQTVITDVPVDNKGHNTHSTQTFTYTKNNSDSPLHSALTSDIKRKDKSHLNNEVESGAINKISELKLASATIEKDKPGNKGPKCKTNVRAASNYKPVAPAVSSIDIDNLPTDNGGKVIVLHKNAKSKSSQKPICLGKNKILLCSLQPLSRTSMVDVTHLVETIKPQLVCYGVNADIPSIIPSGVHLVLLPNQELVLSIDPGVELSPYQINYLPTILNLVQQQLFKLGAINKLPKAYTIGDIIHLSDDETDNNTSQDESYDDNTSLKNKEETHRPTNLKFSDPKNDISFNEKDSCAAKHTDSSLNMVSSETLSVAPIKEFVNENKNIPEIDASNTESAKEVKQQHTLSNDSNLTILKDVVLNDSKKDNLKDTANMPKKTIISDLMAMSGISFEDTAVTNIETPINQIPPEPKPIPILPKPSKEPDNLYTNKDNEMNNKIYNNPFVKAALTKCPELFIVYSFEDLKYAYENNGQFYKMNVDNGIIVPISVSVKSKKQTTAKKMKFDKSVIDLTEEDNNDTSGEEAKSEESSIQTFIERDLITSGVKPIKLFKSVHPSILRHNFKTLSMRRYSEDSKRQKKKVTKAVKRKGKHAINITDSNSRPSKKLRQGVEKNYNYSESDDEPLALKAKRIRRTSVDISKNIDNVESHHENCQIDVQPLNEQEDNCDESTSLSVPMLVEEDHDSSSHLPIIFQSNNDESSGEDCILGV